MTPSLFVLFAALPGFAEVGAARTPSEAPAMLPEDNDDGDRVPDVSRSHNAWQERPWALEVELGIATPVGMAGLMLDYSLFDWVSLGCGGGTNLYVDTALHGLEGACMLHLRPIKGRERAFSVGLGASIASFRKTELTGMGAFGLFLGGLTQIREGPGPVGRTWDVAYFVNLEVGYERRSPEGPVFRVYGGIAELANPADGVPDEPVSPSADGIVSRETTLFYAGVAFGRAFGVR